MNGLLDFTERFFGYGNLSAPVWFIGLEEGGGRDLTEIDQRVRTWERRGAKSVDDLAGFHRDIGVTRFFDGPRPALQKTWCALMKALQSYRGAQVDPDSLRKLQATDFGASDGMTALLELLPLPSKDNTSWIYSDLALTFPMLASRQTYEEAVRPQRIKALRALVAAHAPELVVCYGMSERPAWQTIAGSEFEELRVSKHRCLLHRGPPTTIAVVPHPEYARSSEFWVTLGATLRPVA